jgi:hypothetical protein
VLESQSYYYQEQGEQARRSRRRKSSMLALTIEDIHHFGEVLE